MEIDRQIEYQDEALRGEHGEEAQKAAEERVAESRRMLLEQREFEDVGLTLKRLEGELGSPALAKACLDPFDYAVKLRSGEVIRFHQAEWHGNGWLTLKGQEGIGIEPTPGSPALPFCASRGVDVRLTEILWAMDAPPGS